jgi:TDG/mug DNA glycosylase family protein
MKTLPDYLRRGMKLVIVGCNPSESSVRVGHYYAGRGNQFWPALYEGGVVPEPLEYRDDKRVIEFGVGLTDLVKRPTKGIEELTREDFAEGRIVLSQKLEEFAPHVVAFNGKLTKRASLWRLCVCASIHEWPEHPRRARKAPAFSKARATCETY